MPLYKYIPEKTGGLLSGHVCVGVKARDHNNGWAPLARYTLVCNMPKTTMVLILDGSSEIGAHVRSNFRFCNLFHLHLIRLD